MYFLLDYLVKALNLGKPDSRKFKIDRDGVVVDIELNRIEEDKKTASIKSTGLLLSGICEKPVLR